MNWLDCGSLSSENDEMPEQLETDYIVLRKQEYGDRSLIISGISPDYGRLDFILRGAVGGVNRSYPAVDLFRLLHIAFTQGDDSLGHLKSVELIENFDSLAQNYPSYETAIWIATFSLLNVMPMLQQTLYANAVEVALRRLANRSQFLPEAIMTGVCITFLYESGWLTHALQDSSSREQCRVLLEMASGKEAPNLSGECWRQQLEWCKSMLLYNECRLP